MQKQEKNNHNLNTNDKEALGREATGLIRNGLPQVIRTKYYHCYTSGPGFSKGD